MRVLPLCAAAAAAVVVSAAVGPPAAVAQKGNEKTGGPAHVFSGSPPNAGPFDVILGRPTDKAVTASVMAYQLAEAFISYGPAAGAHPHKTPVRTLAAVAPVEFVLADLPPNARVFYRLHTRSPGGEFAPGEERSFHTARPPGSAFHFTLQADSHLDSGTRPAVYERTLANCLAGGTDFHVDLGDTFMTDKYPKHTDALPQYVAQRYYFGRLAHSAPLFLVLGNHDGERLDREDGTPDSMPVWSALARKKLFPNPRPDGFYTGNATARKHVGSPDNYYAWEWGDALFVALDPFSTTGRTRGKNKTPEGNWARTLGKEQYDWLARTLAGSKARHKFVFIHHLVGGLDDSARGGAEAAVLYEWGGKGKDGRDAFKEQRPGWPAPIHQLLVTHKVSAVFHGHDHFYASQELDGVAYVMVPQPGHPGGEKLRNADEYGYVRGTFLPPAGHVRVTVGPGPAWVEYVRSWLPAAETGDRRNSEIAHRATLGG